MTTPDVPLRMELTFELPGTAEQVWDAIATANGISSWFVRTDLEEREGGRIVMHMGPDAESPGTVTGWDPPHRFAVRGARLGRAQRARGRGRRRSSPSSSSRRGPGARASCGS